MVAGDKIADKIRKSIFNSSKPLIKDPFIGPIEDKLNLFETRTSILS